MNNLLLDLPADLSAEITQRIYAGDTVRIERIISHGQSSPDGYWYDQDEHEWVLLLAGAARLSIAGETHPRELHPGDHLLLPAHQQHRVEWTTPDEPTIWLAVFVAVSG